MPSNYGSFNVLLFNNADSSTSPVAGATVKLYDATNHVDLGVSLTSDANGVIAAGAAAVAAGVVVRFRVEDDGHGRAGWCYQTTVAGSASAGMDLLLRPSPAGHNLYFYAMAQEPYRIPASVVPAFFEVAYWLAPRADGTGGEQPSAAKRIGFYNVGQVVTIPLNLYRTQPIWVGAKSYNSFGVPNVQDWSDLPASAIEYLTTQRITGAPTLSQYSATTVSSVTLSISGYDAQLVRYRAIQATDSGGTAQVETLGISGSVGTAGTLIVTVSATGINPNVGVVSKSVSVSVLGTDNATNVASKIAVALGNDPDVNRMFQAMSSSSNVTLTARFPTANDPAMQMQLTLGTATGIAPATSTHTTAGVKSPYEQDSVIDLTTEIANSNYQFVTVLNPGSWTFRVAHSGGSPKGPWSAWSNALLVTFASGGGGTGGTGDPTPPDHQPSYYLPL